MVASELSPKEKISIASRLNDRFKKDTCAYEVLEDIRSFSRPIAVDFNNVLASNMDPIVINPEAPAFLAHLRKIGDVFIVTTAQDWQAVHKILRGGEAWSSGQVLMTLPNWRFITQFEDYNPKGVETRKSYLDLARSIGWDIKEQDLVTPPGYKPIAPIFAKPWAIPLVDDSGLATHNNPGVLGICVQSFEPLRTWHESYQLMLVGFYR